MSLKGLECQVSKSVHSDACPRPTTRPSPQPQNQSAWAHRVGALAWRSHGRGRCNNDANGRRACRFATLGGVK